MALGKVQRFGAANRAMDSIGEMLTQSDDTGGALETVSVEKIRLDPDQPRTMRLSRTAPQLIDANAHDRERLLEELEKVRELAESIRINGLAQPIAVYRHGDHYVLAWGERRLLAHVILGREGIPAKILPGRPRNLLALQLVENMQRKDLSLRERVRGMERLVEEAGRGENPIASSEDLGRALGLGQSMSYAYWTILQGPSDVRDAIDDGRLKHFREAQRIAVMKVDGERAEALLAISTGAPSVETSATLVARAASVTPKAVRRGRPLTAVSLPRVDNAAVVHYIAEKLCTKQEFNKFSGVDWTDLKAAGDILRQIIKKLERQMAPQQANK
jgi:ParB family transcriptional regulator, chromosome partitioning protein